MSATPERARAGALQHRYEEGGRAPIARHPHGASTAWSSAGQASSRHVTAAAILMLAGPPLTLHAWAQGGGGAGERGAATHQHLDSAFSYDRYYYDRGYAVHKPPAGGLTDLIGLRGE